jgi:hypothetical protein
MIFELQPGEKKLSQSDVRLVADRRTYPATLILTNRRAVLTFMKTPRPWLWFFNWFIALVLSASARARKPRVRHQIRRDKFASVERGDGGILVFHDTGEGYAHTSFAVQSTEPIASWQERMERWSTEAIADDPLPLPAARVVER